MKQKRIIISVIPSILVRFFQWLNDLMHYPLKVFLICLGFAFASLVLEGSLFQLWSLHRDHAEFEKRISQIRKESKELQMKIAKTSDPAYVELEARNRLDMAGQGDLIFIFSEE